MQQSASTDTVKTSRLANSNTLSIRHQRIDVENRCLALFREDPREALLYPAAGLKCVRPGFGFDAELGRKTLTPLLAGWSAVIGDTCMPAAHMSGHLGCAYMHDHDR